MPNPPDDSSWDSSDLMPPAARPDSEPTTPIAGSTPGDAVSQAIDAIARSNETPAGPRILSAVDENRALNEAVIKLRRGLFEQARAEVDSIIEQRPTSAAAYELRGDICLALADLDGADKDFRSALAFERGRRSAETKLAHVALQRARMTGGAPATQPIAGDRRLWAVLGSLVIPGAGQLVNGRYAVGGGLILVTLIAVILMTSGVDVHGLENTLNQDVAAVNGTSDAIPNPPSISWTFWLGAALATGAWLFSLVDAAFPKSRLK